jgi:hypothetical protein
MCDVTTFNQFFLNSLLKGTHYHILKSYLHVEMPDGWAKHLRPFWVKHWLLEVQLTPLLNRFTFV